MLRRAQTTAHQPTASWKRELLQPLLIGLVPVAYMITQLDRPGENTFLLVAFLVIGIVFLTLLFPEQMVRGSQIHSPAVQTGRYAFPALSR